MLQTIVFISYCLGFWIQKENIFNFFLNNDSKTTFKQILFRWFTFAYCSLITIYGYLVVFLFSLFFWKIYDTQTDTIMVIPFLCNRIFRWIHWENFTNFFFENLDDFIIEHFFPSNFHTFWGCLNIRLS